MAKAKEAEVNKSEAIRAEIEASPKASAKEVVDALKAKGIETNEGLFYQVRRKMGGKKKAKAAKAPAAHAKASAGTNGKLIDPVEVGHLFQELRTVAARYGGAKNLIELVRLAHGDFTE